MFKTYKNECNKYGFCCEDVFGDIIIKTNYETWKFTPTNGKIVLYHKNSIGKTQRHAKNDYHIEFREYITPSQLLKYISEHEAAKYTKRNKPFSVVIQSKQDQYNRMKMQQLKKMVL